MRLFFVLSCWIFLSMDQVFAQPQNHNWNFGGDIWLAFNSGEAEIREPLEFWSWEAGASISDRDGSLLIYTNGVEVYNKHGEVISEIEVSADDSLYYKSLTQGVLILPGTLESGKYSIIGISRYAVVDMSLDSGNGGMFDFPAWKPLDLAASGFGEKNIAIRHGNGRDWWVVQSMHTYNLATQNWDTLLVCYFFDSEGVRKRVDNTINFRGSVGSLPAGEMTVSHDGSKIALVFYGSVLVYSFNRCTGEFVEELCYIVSLDKLYGAAFSKSGRYLYFTQTSGYPAGSNILYQLDVQKNQYGENEIQKIYERDKYINYSIGQLELGPDDRIYIATYGPGFFALNMNLAVVRYPDLPGIMCGFDTLGVWLGGNRSSMASPTPSTTPLALWSAVNVTRLAAPPPFLPKPPFPRRGKLPPP